MNATMCIKHILKELSAHFVSLTKGKLSFGPQGKMVLKNLEDQWFLHCVTMPSYNVFLSDDVNTTAKLITTATCSIPFGLAKLRDTKNNWNQNVLAMPITKQKSTLHKTATVTIINDDVETKNLFHKLQKERKIWWRRLSQQPCRFILAEVKKQENHDLVDIIAQLPFGNIIVEKITCYTDIPKLKICDKNDLSHRQMIEHIVSLDWGCLALLCDAYDVGKKTRTYIHSKLAPHKVAFRIKKLNDEMNAENNDLNRFVLYLNNTLRKKGLNTILTDSEQIIDTFLVPFIVLVDTTSLHNGIVHVMDRSTTLGEAVHVTDLVKYISMRC